MRSLLACILCIPLVAPAFPADVAPGEGDLRARIQEAIEKGRKALLGRVDGVLKGQAGDFPAGRIGIILAALLKSGAPIDDPRVQAALAKLEAAKIEKTYCAACGLFALGGLSRAGGGYLEPPARKLMEDLTRWLVEARLKGHGSWTYEPAQKQDRHDFSNTQFAVLGLRIAMEHGVEVPRDALRETAKLFVAAMTRDATESPVEYTVETSLEAKLKLTRVDAVRRCRVAAGGWGYTDPRRGRSKLDEPYASMTAAGASSLAIALEALRGVRGLTGEDARLIADGERALQSAFGWIAQHFDLFLADGKQMFYTLYSLEKAGDVCRVEKFGSHDWYAEGAARILEKQQPGGGWGSYVDTSLALLFLTRATRPFEAAPAPAILTGGGGGKDKPASGAADPDLVYIERANGFLSARSLLKYMGETRRPELATVGEEIVRHYAPDSRENLLPDLLELWSKPDRITAFAQRALLEITGLKSPQRGEYEAWLAQLQSIRALESAPGAKPDELAALIRATSSPRLKAKLASLAQRKALRGLASTLVAELSVPSTEYRKTLHGILALWLGDGVTAPAGSGDAAWETTARAWQAWWAAHGAEWEAREKR